MSIGKKMGFLDGVKNNSLLQEFDAHERHYFLEQTTSQDVYYFLTSTGKKYIALYRGKRSADSIWIYAPIETDNKTKKLLEGKITLLECFAKNKEYYLAYIRAGKLRNLRKLDLKGIPKTYRIDKDEKLSMPDDEKN